MITAHVGNIKYVTFADKRYNPEVVQLHKNIKDEKYSEIYAVEAQMWRWAVLNAYSLLYAVQLRLKRLNGLAEKVRMFSTQTTRCKNCGGRLSKN